MKLVNSLALVLVFLACHVACMNGLMKGVVKSSLRKAVKNNRAIFKATSMNKKNINGMKNVKVQSVLIF